MTSTSPELAPFGVEHRDPVAGLDAVLEELVGEGHGRQFRVLAVVDERDRQPRADRDAFFAARAAFSPLLDLEIGQAADVVRVDMNRDPAGRPSCTGRRGFPGRSGAPGRRRFLPAGYSSGSVLPRLGFEDFGGLIPFFLDLADVMAEGAGDLRGL